MEKIRSGQPYLYRKNGYNSTVIDVRMKDKVRGDYLTRALTSTCHRFPYMTSKLVEKDGCFYLAKNQISMVAVKTDKFRQLGSMETGYHLIDVTYYDNKIKVAFHHGLCDGRGVKPFVETLIYYYCSIRYNKVLSTDRIRLEGQPLLEGETNEPLNTEYYQVDSGKVPTIYRDGYALPECTGENAGHYRTEIVINQNDYIEFAKSISATPAILTAILASKSIMDLNPNADKPVVCSMATDYRSAMGLDNTHKNFTGSCYLPYTAKDEKIPLVALATLYRHLLSEQKSPDAVKASLNMQIGLFNKLDTIKTLEEKRNMLSFFNDICVNTYVISYLGQMNIGECNQFIDSMHLYSSGSRGLTFNMIAAGDTISIDVLHGFDTDKYVKSFLVELNKTGAAYQVTERFEFETGKDRSHVTASHQAERHLPLIASRKNSKQRIIGVSSV